ncbi:hypothetical protein [Marinomonas sp. PE14-40]|uniref:hypothetical protein n=1 Tax=Marinomonas sp. PE14-40 TaxID=3060621 RepID=UPI003F67466A
MMKTKKNITTAIIMLIMIGTNVPAKATILKCDTIKFTRDTVDDEWRKLGGEQFVFNYDTKESSITASENLLIHENISCYQRDLFVACKWHTNSPKYNEERKRTDYWYLNIDRSTLSMRLRENFGVGNEITNYRGVCQRISEKF